MGTLAQSTIGTSMRRNIAKGRIHPKISTMPRQQSEAAAFLDIYKLVIEKKRLQQELESMDQRRQQILTRLTVLDSQVADLEHTAHQLRDAAPTPDAPLSQAPIAPTFKRSQSVQTSTGDLIDALFLEY